MAKIREVEKKYAKLVGLLKERELTVSAMESCTGGLIASMITDVSGSSEVFPGSYVTYSNDEKEENGIPRELIEESGVYSAEMAEGMARAIMTGMKTGFGIGITGTLGRRDPANADSIPGVVYAAVCGPIKKHTVGEFEKNTRCVKLELPPGKDTPAHRRQAKLRVADAVAGLLLATLGESC